MEQDVRVADDTAGNENGQLVIIKRGVMEEDVRVAGDTAGIETGQLLNIKRSVCHSAFCNYKYIVISRSSNSIVCYALQCNESE
jgi:hypothetical protein